jgi:sarcosine oxidase gamma subunit
VEGQQLTLREGTKTATYKTVTLTIPNDAKVRVNGRAASLADVQPDQRAVVVQGPNVTRVFAAARHG